MNTAKPATSNIPAVRSRRVSPSGRRVAGPEQRHQGNPDRGNDPRENEPPDHVAHDKWAPRGAFSLTGGRSAAVCRHIETPRAISTAL